MFSIFPLITVTIACHDGVFDTTNASSDTDAVWDSEPDTSTIDTTFVDSAPIDIEVAPAWASDVVATEIEAALENGLPNPTTLWDVYFQLIAEGQDADCPGSNQFSLGGDIGCISDLGYTYSGYSTWMESSSDQGHTQWIWADFEIITADGDSYFGGGRATYNLDIEDENTSTWFTQVTGSWLFEGHDSWLGQGVSSELTTWGGMDMSEGWVQLLGSVTILQSSFYFDNLMIASNCTAQAGGALWVRDPNGGWYHITFGDTCDGCGTLSYGNEEVGTTCVDLQPLNQMLNAEFHN